MVDMVYTWDVQTKTWTLCRDEKLRHGDIRNLPWALAIKFNNHYDVCINGTAMQGIRHLEELNNFSGLVSCLPYRECHDVYFFPLRWRISKGDNHNYIFVGVDCLKAKIVVYGYRSYELAGFQEEVVSYTVDIGKQRLLPTNQQYMYIRQKSICSEAISMPGNIAAEVCRLMQEEAEKIFGLKPIINMQYNGWEFIENFASRPYDANIAYWKDILGKDVYEAKFPYEQKDNFHLLCDYLGIENPPEDLHNAYCENPYAPMIYILMQQLGLKDINYIKRFFNFQEDIMNFYLHKFKFNSETHRMYRERQCSGNLWNAIENFCNFVAERKSQQHLADMLYKLTTLPLDDSRGYAKDVYMLFYKYQNVISEELLTLLADRDPTSVTRALLATELIARRRGKYYA